MKDTLTSATRGVIPSSNFLLAIGKELLSFSKVSNISRTLDYDTFIEGGLNTMVRTFTKPKQQQETLILEKGISITQNYTNAVYKKLGLRIGGRIKQAVTLVVLGGDRKYMDRYYSFNEGVVIKWEVGNLDALSKEVMIERFEIAHSGLQELMRTDLDYR